MSFQTPSDNRWVIQIGSNKARISIFSEARSLVRLNRMFIVLLQFLLLGWKQKNLLKIWCSFQLKPEQYCNSHERSRSFVISRQSRFRKASELLQGFLIIQACVFAFLIPPSSLWVSLWESPSAPFVQLCCQVWAFITSEKAPVLSRVRS